MSDLDTFIVVQSPGPQGPAGNGSVSSSLGWYSVKDYGALGNNSNNDTTAIQDAIDAMPADGGVLFFPTGTYKCTGLIDLSERRNIIIRGNGGTSGGAQTATLLYTTQTGAGSFLDCRSTSGVVFRDMDIGYSSGSYTGRLVDFRLLTGDSAYGGMENCLVVGLAVATARLVDLGQALFMNFENCVFGGADIAIYGKASAGSYSSSNHFRGCVFNSCTTVAIRNPDSWQIIGCGFEGSGGSAAKAIDHDSGVLARGLTISGCWTGDSSGGTVFKLAGKGIAMTGNYIGASSGTGINIDAVSDGVLISGNVFDSCTTAVDISSSTAHTNVNISANGYTSVTTPLTGSLATGSGILQTSTDVKFYDDITINDDVTLASGSVMTWATDTNLYRGAANQLKTDDWLYAVGAITVNNKISLTGDNSNLFVTDATGGGGNGRGIVAQDINAVGNLIVSTAGKGLQVKEGSNAKMGTATLASGTVVVSTTAVTASSRIQLTIQSLGTVAAPKAIGVTARTGGTSFTITSADATDTSVVAWILVEPA